jgi:SAM-dependent methyltransferase
MTSRVAKLDRALYPNYQSNWDDTLFRERILAHITPTTSVLDLGAGAGILPQMNFRGLAREVCGVDLDPRVTQNPMLDEGRLADANSIPYEDARFDVVFSDNVLEHLDQPLLVFKEVVRVLKPGGVYLVKTPNRRHYVPTIARLTPHAFHTYVASLRGRLEEDTFPTLYKANSRSDIQRLAQLSGLTVERIELIEGRPEYLRMSWPTYLAGAAYERTVNATSLLSGFRVLLVGTLRKPG